MAQEALRRVNGKTYLEIGVCNGVTFFSIQARRKIAIDPHFAISRRQKLRHVLRHPLALRDQYYETTSDEFFQRHAPALFRNQPVDVALVDGLHTCEQALRDVLNCLRFLGDHGLIIMHDCFPSSEAAAHPAQSLKHAASLGIPGWTGKWCGDVWKAVAILRASRRDVEVHTLDADCGLGLIRKGHPETTLDLSSAEIERLTYRDLAANPQRLINLKAESFAPSFLDSLKAANR